MFSNSCNVIFRIHVFCYFSSIQGLLCCFRIDENKFVWAVSRQWKSHVWTLSAFQHIEQTLISVYSRTFFYVCIFVDGRWGAFCFSWVATISMSFLDSFWWRDWLSLICCDVPKFFQLPRKLGNGICRFLASMFFRNFCFHFPWERLA